VLTWLVRQEVIRQEKKLESAVRWLRIIVRSLPMIFYILVLPYLIVFHIIHKANERREKSTIVYSLMAYLIGVLVLQMLGAIRVYHSWAAREVTVPPPPKLYVDISSNAKTNELSTTYSWCSCFGKNKHSNTGRNVSGNGSEKTKTQPPPVPNTFLWNSPANILELLSLTLEFWQMASFSLQNDPYYNNTDDDGTGASDNDDDDTGPSHFWGKKLFQTLYVRVTVGAEAQFGLMWTTIGLVGVLITIFSLQFLSELRTYGQLMKHVEDKDLAKDSFFFSFTGAIVYGHGTPTNISERMRFVVAIISDALFLVLSFQLLQVISCTYDTSDGSDDSNAFATLRTESGITCWEGHHAIVATAALVAYAFYVPLSIMITPMLLQAPSKEPTDDDASNASSSGASGGVSYLKLYLMTVNVIKSIMLVVVVLGPEKVLTAVVSSTVSSFILGALTLLWFQSHDIHSSHYSEDIHPCNIAFINYWKAASYTAAVVSALIILTAHILQKSHFPPRVLTGVLVATWLLVAALYFIAYRRFDKGFQQRRKLVADLIHYPFQHRDDQEKQAHMQKMKSLRNKKKDSINGIGATAQRLFGKTDGSNFETKTIPGSVQSPWYDSKNHYNRPANVPSIIEYDGGLTMTAWIVAANPRGKRR
jgi:hypothetical protein